MGVVVLVGARELEALVRLARDHRVGRVGLGGERGTSWFGRRHEHRRLLLDDLFFFPLGARGQQRRRQDDCPEPSNRCRHVSSRFKLPATRPRRAGRPRARAASRAARSVHLMRTANSSLAPPTRASSKGPAKSVLHSASSSGLTAANVASLLGAARRSLTRNSSSLVAKLTLPASAGSRSSSAAACSVRRARSPSRSPGGQPRALAVVQQAGPALAFVHEVIGAVADQHDAGTLRHVPVVGDVDGQLGEQPLLDPAVEHRDEVLDVDGARRFGRQVNLQLQLVRFHGFRGRMGRWRSGAAGGRRSGPAAPSRAGYNTGGRRPRTALLLRSAGAPPPGSAALACSSWRAEEVLGELAARRTGRRTAACRRSACGTRATTSSASVPTFAFFSRVSARAASSIAENARPADPSSFFSSSSTCASNSSRSAAASSTST